VKSQAQKVACDVIASLEGRGVFAVELFLLKDGRFKSCFPAGNWPYKIED
jgi:phosphoribosylaminoimidazole carboxylase (NCAIR synthetase)